MPPLYILYNFCGDYFATRRQVAHEKPIIDCAAFICTRACRRERERIVAHTQSTEQLACAKGASDARRFVAREIYGFIHAPRRRRRRRVSRSCVCVWLLYAPLGPMSASFAHICACDPSLPSTHISLYILLLLTLQRWGAHNI